MGLAFYFINDFDNQFYPVICVEMNELNYEKINRDAESFTSEMKFRSKIEYYNLKAGFWEPFIEMLEMKIMYDKQN